MSTEFEVPEPIICSPFEEPAWHWHLEEGREPRKEAGRRPSAYFYREPVARDDGEAAGTAVPLPLVNLIRERVKQWRHDDYPGATRTTLELLRYWRRDGRRHRLFFAQLEAAETIIFLTEARRDYLQGVSIPIDEPSERQQSELGYKVFTRHACKMATGSGKTTVMALLASWSIINKVHDRGNARSSDVVLVVCPNVTIRNRLAEIDPRRGDSSVYRTRDLMSDAHLKDMQQGRVLVTNWHVFEPHGTQAGGVSSKVVKAGVRLRTREFITIGAKTTTARGRRYLTPEEFEKQVDAGMLSVLDREEDRDGNLSKVYVESERYIESDTALVNRVLGKDVGGKQNILVINDEAHHAYRIRKDEPDPDEADLYGEEDDAEDFYKEAGVGRRPGPHSQAARHQQVHGFVGDALLPGAGRTRQQSPVPLGGQRLLSDRRDRIGIGQDSATRRQRHLGRRGSRILQRLEVDRAAADAGGTWRQAWFAETRSHPEVCKYSDGHARWAVGPGAQGMGGFCR